LDFGLRTRDFGLGTWDLGLGTRDLGLGTFEERRERQHIFIPLDDRQVMGTPVGWGWGSGWGRIPTQEPACPHAGAGWTDTHKSPPG